MIASATRLGIISFLLLLGCSGDPAREYDERVRDALAAVPEVMKLEERFSRGRHFIANYGSGKETLDSLYFIHERYKITVSVPLVVDRAVKRTGEGKVYIHEITDVDVNDGVVAATVGRQWIVKLSDLTRSFDAGHGWAGLGVAILTDSPTPNFEDYVTGLHKDLREVRPTGR